MCPDYFEKTYAKGNDVLSLSIHSTDLEALEADVLVLGVLKGWTAVPGAELPCLRTLLRVLTSCWRRWALQAPDQLLRLPGLEDTGAGIVALAGLRL